MDSPDPTLGGTFTSVLVVDGKEKLYNAAYSSPNDPKHETFDSSGCTGVLQLNKGDRVWIRKFQKYGNFLRKDWTSFSGWQVE